MDNGASRGPLTEAISSEYVRVKRKKTTIFLYVDQTDTSHDLRAKVNLITKVPTTDIKFFLDKNGELPIDAYVTHRLSGVENTLGAVDALHGGDCLRAVVSY